MDRREETHEALYGVRSLNLEPAAEIGSLKITGLKSTVLSIA
jgi:hypothetical protein